MQIRYTRAYPMCLCLWVLYSRNRANKKLESIHRNLHPFENNEEEAEVEATQEQNVKYNTDNNYDYDEFNSVYTRVYVHE